MQYDVYLSGPISGLPYDNHPAFNAAASQLRDLGLTVFNPAENFGGDATRTRAEYMRLDVAALLDSRMIVMLDGWTASKGAKLKVAIAGEIDVPIRTLSWVLWTLQETKSALPFREEQAGPKNHNTTQGT